MLLDVALEHLGHVDTDFAVPRPGLPQ
jgi:hypothetical protein